MLPRNAIQPTDGGGRERNGEAVTSQQLSVLMQRVIGLDNTSNFTPQQVDEVLAQRREISGYIHKDRVRDSWDSKFYLVAILIFVLIFSGSVLYLKPDLFAEVLSFLAGIFGGGLGGYGFAKAKK